MSALPLRRLEGKYEILEKIREGGMGAIYKVRHRLLDEVRVVKLMRPQLVDDEGLRARFLREAQVAIKLRHPNIAQLYDFTTDDEDGTALIVMEFIPGKTIEEVLKATGPPPLGLTLEIARQSLRALAYLHGKGFIHRDISPDNLMLTEDPDGKPQVKLIDLGIAKILGGGETNLTQTGAFLGKIRYASPEQFSGEGAVTDPKGDLYSFGIVLYELLTGIYPISGRDTSSIMAGHLFHPPRSFEETDPQGVVPPGLRAAVLRALAKKADERYSNAQEFSDELTHCRTPNDLPGERWKQLLTAAGRNETVTLAPGTTQDRLDEHFLLEPTPAPPPPPVNGGRTLVMVPRRVEAPEPSEPPEPSAPSSTTDETTLQLPPAVTSLSPSPSSRSRPRAILWIVALAALGLMGGGWLLTHRGGREPVAAPLALPSAAPPPVVHRPEPAPPPLAAAPALPGGTLQIDALPWGEVVEIRDDQGKEWPVPPVAVTPLVLTLPIGRYTLRLKNPAFPAPLSLHVEVPAHPAPGARPVVGEFRRIDVDQYLKGMGW